MEIDIFGTLINRLTMDFCSLLANIHWIPVLVLTVLSFALGFAWHQPFLFGKAWKAENFPNGLPQFNGALIFGGTAVMHLLALAGLSAVVSGQGAMSGLLTGLLIGVLWVLPAMAGTYLFANRSLRLLAIDAGMYLVLLALCGLLLGMW